MAADRASATYAPKELMSTASHCLLSVCGAWLDAAGGSGREALLLVGVRDLDRVAGRGRQRGTPIHEPGAV